MSKAVVLFSGGLDSTTCLYWAKRRFGDVLAISFDYNQRHALELESAQTIARMAEVDHEVVQMGSIFAGISPLTDQSREVSTFKSADAVPAGLANFVPGRNILFLTIAANRAYVMDCEHVIIGVSEGYFNAFPDCRQHFLLRMSEALSSGLGREMTIMAPMMGMSKRQTIDMASSLPGCMDALAHTTTCFNGTKPPCDKCPACLARWEGFKEAGIADPLLSPAKPAKTKASRGRGDGR